MKPSDGKRTLAVRRTGQVLKLKSLLPVVGTRRSAGARTSPSSGRWHRRPRTWSASPARTCSRRRPARSSLPGSTARTSPRNTNRAAATVQRRGTARAASCRPRRPLRTLMTDFEFIDDPFNEFRPGPPLWQGPPIRKGNHPPCARQLASSPDRPPARGSSSTSTRSIHRVHPRSACADGSRTGSRPRTGRTRRPGRGKTVAAQPAAFRARGVPPGLVASASRKDACHRCRLVNARTSTSGAVPRVPGGRDATPSGLAGGFHRSSSGFNAYTACLASPVLSDPGFTPGRARWPLLTVSAGASKALVVARCPTSRPDAGGAARRTGCGCERLDLCGRMCSPG